ncbi:MAG: hypothetical protein LBN30_01825 [Oscillospiraceae bacterium]|jgi:type II secretory pathway pseudopilin PulG|nr:hypothetical protein [Oscillospiraceae bacterium]
MKGGSGTKTSLFLVELIIALLLFAFCAAICIQAFSLASRQSHRSDALSKSVFFASSAAELYKARNDLAVTAESFGGVSVDMDTERYIVAFDKDWQQVAANAETDKFRMYLTETDGNVLTIDVYESGTGDSIYSLKVKAVS